MEYQVIIDFWFKELTPKEHWQKSDSFDQMLRNRFLEWHEAAAMGELYEWRNCPLGRLAEILILDQFSRNIYRDQPQSFASDGQALCLAQEAIANGSDEVLPAKQRTFLYMPFMHSESSLIHEQALILFSQPGLEDNLDYEQQHKAIIDRFGRYPHRNAILGRESTAEELEFLKQPGSSF